MRLSQLNFLAHEEVVAYSIADTLTEEECYTITSAQIRNFLDSESEYTIFSYNFDSSYCDEDDISDEEDFSVPKDYLDFFVQRCCDDDDCVEYERNVYHPQLVYAVLNVFQQDRTFQRKA